jgi:hypothetical protein
VEQTNFVLSVSYERHTFSGTSNIKSFYAFASGILIRVRYTRTHIRGDDRQLDRRAGCAVGCIFQLFTQDVDCLRSTTIIQFTARRVRSSHRLIMTTPVAPGTLKSLLLIPILL